MKKQIKSALFASVALCSIVACNKDQMAVKKLDGHWLLTDAISWVRGVEQSKDTAFINSGIEYHFETCKLKKEVFCAAHLHYTFLGTPIMDTFLYKIADKGETFIQDNDENTTTTDDQRSAHISELSKTKFTFKYADSDTSEMQITLTKQAE